MTEEPAPPESLTPRPGRDAFGWLASFALHALVCVVLAVSTLPPLPLAVTFSLLGEPPPAERIDDLLSLEEVDFDAPVEDLSESLDASSLDAALAPPTPDAIAAAPTPTVDLSSLLATSSIATPTDLSLSGVAGVGTDGRTAVGKAALVAAKGGSPASEAAVARGLSWLADHQNPDGTWSLVHTAGRCRGRCDNPGEVPGKDPFGRSLASATGLALLPFLGAGETPTSGKYRREVRRGLEALVRMGRPDDDTPGLSWADSGRMYAHGISTIVLCEAYGLTGDRSLRAPAQAALAYLAYAQDPRGGGWRYTAQDRGDTSVTGWQIMALKSGALAGLETPRRVASRASTFLDAASGDGGSSYGYLAANDPERDADEPFETRPTLSAVGLLCRMYLDWDQSDPRLARGVRELVDRGPMRDNYYYNYYAAQTIFHQTGGSGPLWTQWNEGVRDLLVEQQETRGHERGSWWVEGPHNDRGGRLYTTALATMTLEVYYRYLPLYQAEAVEVELPD